MLSTIEAARTSSDRVRRSTPSHLNEKIDREIARNVETYGNTSQREIQQRIHDLDREWDVERVLEVNASTLALTGLVLSLTVNKSGWYYPQPS